MPGFDFSEAAIDAYKAISLHIRQIFAEYTPIIESLSLDKAYLDVTENLAKKYLKFSDQPIWLSLSVG